MAKGEASLIEPKVAKILQMIAKGDWEGALPRDLYKDLRTWFANHKAEEAVIRIIFFDTERQGRFACHMLCVPEECRNVKTIYLPDNQYWEKDKQFLLSVPSDLLNTPLFCLPNNTLDRALKKRRKKLQ